MAAHLLSRLVAVSLMFWLSAAAKYDGKQIYNLMTRYNYHYGICIDSEPGFEIDGVVRGVYKLSNYMFECAVYPMSC